MVEMAFEEIYSWGNTLGQKSGGGDTAVDAEELLTVGEGRSESRRGLSC